MKVAGAFLAAEIDRLQALGVVSGGEDLSAEPPAMPVTLDEAVDYLLPRFKGMKWANDCSEDDFAAFCHSQLSGGIGMKVRNELKLWEHESPLHQHFLSEHKLFHSDDMSNLIIRHIYRKLINQ